jgi:hypothetical protein
MQKMDILQQQIESKDREIDTLNVILCKQLNTNPMTKLDTLERHCHVTEEIEEVGHGA